MASNITSWQKGESGNPNGRPKKKETFSSIYADLLGSPHYEPIGENEDGTPIYRKTKKTKKQALAEASYLYAMGGSFRWFKEIMDRMEGKPVQRMEIEKHEPIQLIKTGLPDIDEE